MKREAKFSDFQRLTKLLFWTALLFSLIFLLTDCFHKQERTTTIYGTITDQNQQPVDSIMVMVNGLVNFNEEELKTVYSDKLGNFELVVEVPKKFHAVDVIVPFYPVENPIYQTNYKGFTVQKNDESTDNCYTASVGEKAKYDFQLIPK